MKKKNTLTTENIEINIDKAQLDSWYPLFCIPCYDRQITEPFFLSMIKLVMMSKEYGLNFAISTISDSLITRARCNLTAKFMANTTFTHMMFLDCDLAFNPEDVLKLLWHDKDVITGAYPVKELNWDTVVKKAKEGVPSKELANLSTRFVVNPALQKTKLEVSNGAISVHDAGTGFMLIKRHVIEKMFAAYPKLKYNDDTGGMQGEEKNNTYALFNSYVDDDGRLLSEDYGFCRYWQKIGGKVWVDPSIEMSHLGRFQFNGSLMNWLIDNSVSVPEPTKKVVSRKKNR